MAVKIRLLRQGAKKSPQYMIVAVDSAKKRDGEYLAQLGHYYPCAKTAKEKVQVNLDSYQAWLRKGAEVTRTVSQIVKLAK